MGWAAGMWAGIGFESGGEIVFGLNQQIGILYSMEDAFSTPRRTRWCVFQQESATIGLGLGGSMGTNLVIGYNADIPADFDGADVGFDFSIDLALGKLSSYFRTLPEAIELAGIARKFDRNWMTVADAMQKYEKNRFLIKSATENIAKNQSGVIGTLNGQTALINFPLPLASAGLRLSVKSKAENTTITSFGTTSF